MRTPFRITFVALAVGLAGWSLAAGPITFESSSRIELEGTSNVHDWTCEAETFMASAGGDATGSTLTSLTALSVTVVPSNLDCGNGTMDKNLRKATGTTPIRYVLTHATVGAARGASFPVTVQGRLTLHGTTRPVAIQAQGKALGGKRFAITGSVPVTMSDYGIDPPRALMGTMRTGDDTTVRFSVTLNASG